MVLAKASATARIAACGVSARLLRGLSGKRNAVSEHDTKRIIRQWDREIEDEIRQAAARNAANGPWKAVVWAALWVLWLGLLVALLAHTKVLG
jgi:hypothetical protein